MHLYHSESSRVGGGQSLRRGILCYLKGVGGRGKHGQVVIVIDDVDSHLSLRLHSGSCPCLLCLDLNKIKGYYSLALN